MIKKPEVCILPVAGLSTRNLPATKALHKGFLTLDSLPIIQYAVDACAEIGVKEIVFIYSDQSCKHLFETYFKPYPWLENHLKEKNKLDLLKVIQDIIPHGMKFSFAEQKEPKGNGHAILMAREIVGDRDFIVMWPDDVYINIHGDGILKQLLKVYDEYGGRVVHAKGLVEKPKLEEVPSNYASMGPYILPNVIMDILPEVSKGSNGEINLTDAMNLAAARGVKLSGVLCDAMRFDCGTNKDLAYSDLKLKLMRNPEMRAYAKDLLDTMFV